MQRGRRAGHLARADECRHDQLESMTRHACPGVCVENRVVNSCLLRHAPHKHARRRTVMSGTPRRSSRLGLTGPGGIRFLSSRVCLLLLRLPFLWATAGAGPLWATRATGSAASHTFRLRGGADELCGSAWDWGVAGDDAVLGPGRRDLSHDCQDSGEPPCTDSDKLLWKSAFEGDVDVVRRALREGAAVNAQNEFDGHRAAVHYAVSRRNATCSCCGHVTPADDEPACRCRMLVLSELVQAGANASQTCAMGTSAMHLAAATGAVWAVRALSQCDGDVGCQDRDRRQPLHYAAMEGRARVSALLLRQGAHVNAPDSYGNTPLAAAARRGHSAVVELLLGWGADGEVFDRLGYSVYSLALRSECNRTISLLSHRYHRKNAALDSEEEDGSILESDNITLLADIHHSDDSDSGYWNDRVYADVEDEDDEATLSSSNSPGTDGDSDGDA